MDEVSSKEKSERVRVAKSTIDKLDKMGKKICEEMGIKDPTYTQIIEYILRKCEKK